jgi:hypothetical protein
MPGCDRGDQTNTRATATEPSAGAGGSIRGWVIYSGDAPPQKIIPGSPQARDESIVVGPRHGLKNVIVYLKDAPGTAGVSATPAVLDQVNCVYVPHVLAIQAGQTLRLKSSDAVMHNVHLRCAVNPDQNFGFPSPGQRDIALALPEAPFPVKCDVHPWMTAWIGVFDHPWFAVTGDDGSFQIDRVPPGNYTLAAWQESLPEQEQPIAVVAGQEKNIQFTFQAP